MIMKKRLFFICLLLISTNLLAFDLTTDFKNHYHAGKDLTLNEQTLLKKYDIYFVPGILAETFIWSDTRSHVDLSLITRDYFSTQVKFLRQKYNIPAKRLSTSSLDVKETRENIRRAMTESMDRNRKVIFVSHSLGGLALLEELVTNSHYQSAVAGIIFLQSPFQGSPLADLLLENPYHLEKIFKPLLPYLHISEATIEYLRPRSRKFFMLKNKFAIDRLIRNIPLMTVAGNANGHNSIFTPLIDIMAHGCLMKIRSTDCLTEVFYKGPYDDSDGMVPLKSSFLGKSHYVKLDGVDHGELILNIPFENYKKEHLTTALLRILISRFPKGEEKSI